MKTYKEFINENEKPEIIDKFEIIDKLIKELNQTRGQFSSNSKSKITRGNIKYHTGRRFNSNDLSKLMNEIEHAFKIAGFAINVSTNQIVSGIYQISKGNSIQAIARVDNDTGPMDSNIYFVVEVITKKYK